MKRYKWLFQEFVKAKSTLGKIYGFPLSIEESLLIFLSLYLPFKEHTVLGLSLQGAWLWGRLSSQKMEI